MITSKRTLLLIPSFLAIIASFLYFNFYRTQINKQFVISNQSVDNSSSPQALLPPFNSKPENQIQTASKLAQIISAQQPPVTQISPDGSITLIMEEQKTNDLITYTFFTSKSESNEKQSVYNTTRSSDHKLSIPFNTWSPDNKYVFIKDEIPSQIGYYAFPISGKTISKDPENIVDLFTQKYPDYIVTDVTGWAAPELLIVNTDKPNGDLGPSFWFNVATQSFTQLTTRFN